MKDIISTIAVIACLLLVHTSYAQDDNDAKRKAASTITLGSRGLKISHGREWSHTNPTWEASGSYYAMTRIDSNDYIYIIPNLRGFYGIDKDTAIQKIAIIFKDSLGEIQTKPLYIPVWKPSIARSKYAANYSRPANSAYTTIPALVTDSTESVTIHFHPYDNKQGGEGLKNYPGTIFIYTGVLPDPPLRDYSDDKNKKEDDFDTHWGILDLGLNTISDNTNYNSTAAKTFLNAPANNQNTHLFDLRQSKSININIYPFMETFYALKRKNQKINISTGLGLQLYNFRYENPITYTHSPNSVVYMDSVNYKKDKLGFDYLNVPLMVTFKTRLHKDKWLVYGVGITAGYSIATWTKQEMDGNKTKVHNDFGFSNFNSCLTGEIGISAGIRFYGSYQLTNMFDTNTGMNQHPISFGIRFFAI